MAFLLALISIQPITREMLQMAAVSKFSDLEDGVPYCCVISIDSIDAIITRNKKDFRHSKIPVLTSDELLSTDKDHL
ncbi:MAG: hypothetical protein ACRBF0_24950 [Calditrichia bacterium]